MDLWVRFHLLSAHPETPLWREYVSYGLKWVYIMKLDI